MKKYLLLLFLLVLPTTSIHLVDQIIEQFDTNTATERNNQAAPKLWNETAAAFMELAVPLGDFINKSLNIADQPLSEEYKALEKLHESMKVRLRDSKPLKSYDFWTEEMDWQLESFEKHITKPLNILSSKVLYFMDPSKKKAAEDFAEMRNNCRAFNGLGIRGIGVHMEGDLSRIYSLNNTAEFVKMELQWLRAKKRFTIRKAVSLTLDQLRSELHELVYAMPLNLLRLRDNQKKINDSVTIDSLLELHDELLKRKHYFQPSWNLVDSISNANYYNRIKIQSFVNMVRREIARLIVNTSVCSHVMYSTTESVKDLLEWIGSKINDITTFIDDYTPKKLNMSTQGVEEVIVRNTINTFMNGTEDIDASRYNELALAIKTALQYAGLKKLEKQILVLPSTKRDPHYTSFFACPQHWCSTILNERGVSVMISRFMVENIDDAMPIQKHVDQIEKPFIEAIKNTYWMDLPTIVKEVEETTNVTLTTRVIRNAAIIRHKTFFSLKCNYPSVAVNSLIHGLPLANVNSQYSNIDRTFTDDKTCFHFFFFV